MSAVVVFAGVRNRTRRHACRRARSGTLTRTRPRTPRTAPGTSRTPPRTLTRIYLAVPCLSVSWLTLVPALVLVSVLACTRTPACIAVVPSLVTLSAIMIPTSARVLPLVLPGTGCVRR